MKIITQQLFEKLQADHELLSGQVVNPEDYSALHSLLIEEQEITIYDITKTKTHPPNTIISVKDHINRTGNNHLIGHQKELKINFVDISKLYKSKQNSSRKNTR
mgnify:FL=1